MLINQLPSASVHITATTSEGAPAPATVDLPWTYRPTEEMKRQQPEEHIIRTRSLGLRVNVMSVGLYGVV